MGECIGGGGGGVKCIGGDGGKVLQHGRVEGKWTAAHGKGRGRDSKKRGG